MIGVGPTLVYKRLASPLHAARASIGAAWTLAVIAAALANDHPFVLLALVLSVLMAGIGAGVGAGLARSLRVVAIVAIPIVAGNVLVSREGLTVFARLGDLGPFGQGDLTLEALVYGVVIALQVTIVMLATTLASLAVDPDELLRGMRRLSFRSALTASLATRMIPLLARDAQRLAEAQRTRPGAPRDAVGRASDASRRGSPSHGRMRARARLLSAIVGSSLDRAMDVAATLELRGFASARRAPRDRRPWSRHDRAFATSAAAILALVAVARVGGVASFGAYPEVHAGAVLSALALSGALVAVALLPFADRRGVEP
jgi:energy-coupling factor transport system permease protein